MVDINRTINDWHTASQREISLSRCWNHVIRDDYMNVSGFNCHRGLHAFGECIRVPNFNDREYSNITDHGLLVVIYPQVRMVRKGIYGYGYSRSSEEANQMN